VWHERGYGVEDTVGCDQIAFPLFLRLHRLQQSEQPNRNAQEHRRFKGRFRGPSENITPGLSWTLGGGPVTVLPRRRLFVERVKPPISRSTRNSLQRWISVPRFYRDVGGDCAGRNPVGPSREESVSQRPKRGSKKTGRYDDIKRPYLQAAGYRRTANAVYADVNSAPRPGEGPLGRRADRRTIGTPMAKDLDPVRHHSPCTWDWAVEQRQRPQR